MTENQSVGKTVWDILWSLISNNKIFIPLAIGFFLGFLVGISKIVDIQLTWENGGARIRNITSNVEGEWDLVNTINTSDYEGFKNMVINWRLYLEQNGGKISGHAIKIIVNNKKASGIEKNRFEITSGRVKDNKITFFYREGANSGKFELLYSRELDVMKGTFTSTAALSNGTSIAFKLE